MSHKKIVISTDFSNAPGGRFKSDGRYSGEAFREEYLIPALKSNNKVTVVLDDVLGFACSFLEESFGVLRRRGFTAFQLEHKLEIISNDDPHLLRQVLSYIKNGEISP